MKSYIGRRPVKKIQESFDRREMTSVDSFVERNFQPERDGLIGGITSHQPMRQEFEYLRDRGRGRISQGLESLETITKAIKGARAHSLVLFDKKMFSSPIEFKESTQDEAVELVINNLGLTSFISAAENVSRSTVDTLRSLAHRMSRDVKNGTFTVDKYKNEALRVCKAVVRTSMNYKG